MLVKCKKCEAKLKITDDKVTEEGVKIRCPKCSSVILVKKPPAKIKETSAEVAAVAPPIDEEIIAPPEEPLSLEEEVTAPEESPSVEEDSLDLEGFDDSFSIDDSLDVPTEAPTDEISLADEGSDAAPELAVEEDFSLDLTDENVTAPAPEEPATAVEDPSEEFQLDTGFDFSEDEALSLDDDLDAGASIGGGADIGFAEEPPTSTPELDASISLKEDEPDASFGVSDPMDDFDKAVPKFVPKPVPRQDRSPRRPPPKKEISGSGVSTRRSIPIIIPIILGVLVLSAFYLAYKKYSETSKEEANLLEVYDYDGNDRYIENEKAGKILIISGKVKNNYSTSRSYLKVEGILYDKDGKVLDRRTVYAGNVPSDTECKKLSMEDINARLQTKFGEGMINLDVKPGTSIDFKLVFDNVDENAITDFKVAGAGSKIEY